MYSLEDLRLGAKGDLGELSPGRRIQLTLGEDGRSRFMYRAVILDSKEQSGPFSYHSGVFLVPKVSSCSNVVTIFMQTCTGKESGVINLLKQQEQARDSWPARMV